MGRAIDPTEGNPMTATASRTGRLFHRISATWTELEHAQRRLIETQTDFGQPAGGRRTDGARRNRANARP
jgi:hypothetical protein